MIVLREQSPFVALLRLPWRRQKKKLVVIFTVVATTFYALRKFPDFRIKNHGVDHESSESYMHEKSVLVNTATENYLNVAIWEEICGHEMRTLKEFPVFPHGPSTRLRTQKLRLNFTPEFEDFGLRIFGFLSPTEAGNYSFYLASSGTSELWISSDSNPQNSKLIANTTAGLSWKYIIKDLYNLPLFAGERYYLEVLIKYGSYRGHGHHVHVTWTSSSWKQHEPKEIPSNVFIPFENDSIDFNRFRTLDRVTKVLLPIHVKQHDPSFVNKEVQRRAEMYLLPFISERDSQNLFPPCGYNPSYLVKGPLERYAGISEMHYTSIYPDDHGDIVEPKPEGVGDFLSFGNDPLDEKTAKAIVRQVWEQIQRKNPG